MAIQSRKRRERGFQASKEGVILLEKKKFELGLSYRKIAEKADLGSEDQVKRLFNPHWKNSKVQRDTIDRIARVLQLDPADIIEVEDLDVETRDAEVLKMSSESTDVSSQTIFNGVEVRNLIMGDIVQKASGKNSVVQTIGVNLKAENAVTGNVTQEA
jgi:DNA-binding Xre family transcriptional regulator